jgi:hypothetical protein
MNVVDSSGWLEYLADGPNADFFAHAMEVTLWMQDEHFEQAEGPRIVDKLWRARGVAYGMSEVIHSGRRTDRPV